MKLYIATPMYGGMAKNQYTISLQNLIFKLNQAGHTISTTTVSNESLITRARNTLAHKFMKTDFDAMLFIDADHGWDPDGVIKMIECGKDLIGAIYPMKGINWENVRLAALTSKANLEEYSGFFAVNVEEGTNINTVKEDEPLPVKAVGTGMMFIARRVFEKLAPYCNKYINNNVGDTGVIMGEEVVEYFTTFIDENKILLSEDYAFCRMWRDRGETAWAAPWVKISHAGDYNFSGKFTSTLEINQLRQDLSKKITENNAKAAKEKPEKK
jgi:hypothetical protein